jgi:hypothetical protein
LANTLKSIAISRNWWDPDFKTNEDTATDIDSLNVYSTVKHLKFISLSVTKMTLEYIIHAFPNLNVLIASFLVLQRFHNTIPNHLWVQFLTFIYETKSKILVGDLGITDISGVLTDFFKTRKSNTHTYT